MEQEYSDSRTREITVTASMTISKDFKIFVPQYYGSEDVIESFEDSVITPVKLAEIINDLFKNRNFPKDLGRKLTYAISDAKDWHIDELEVIEN